MKSILPPKAVNIVFLVVWLGSIATGFALLNWYKSQPGEVGAIHHTWPQSVDIAPDAFRYTLVLFAHPKCECTDATLTELANVLKENPGRIQARVYFYHPQGTGADWVQGSLWQKAHTLSGVEVINDPAGLMARHFGAKTSGQTYLYSADRSLMFAGGITASRGHIGDNKGRRAIASVVQEGQASKEISNAFGCGLFSQTEMDEFKKQEDEHESSVKGHVHGKS